MKKAAFGALFVGLLVACGGGGGATTVHIVDSNTGDADMTCNVLTQTGCMTGEKCTWFHDTETPTPLGHIGCAPTGTVAIGAACTYGADGPQGYDNCVTGSVCVSGHCSQICDDQGGDPMCPTKFACGDYTGLFDSSGMNVAGVCDPTCDPLADNDFDGSGSASMKTGSDCAAGQGCYGFPGTTTATHATCTGEFNTTLVHRSACTVATMCAPDSTHVYLNGCAQGYIPLLDDTTGSTQADCIAYCKPADCDSTSCLNENLRGVSPYDCQAIHMLGTYVVSSSGTAAGDLNGDQCFYSWGFENDSNGNYIPSPTSDTLGYCINHAKYNYDSNGNGMIDGSDATWPKCDTLAIGSGVMGGYDATYFGCVSTTTATAGGNPPFKALKNRPLMDMPHFPYHAVARQH